MSSCKYLTVFSRYLLLGIAPSKMFDKILNTSLEYAYFIYIIYDQSVTVIWFKGFYRRFEWILGFGKVGLLLNCIKRFRLCFYHFLKCLRPGFFPTFWIFSGKYLTVFSRYLLFRKVLSKLFDGVLNTPLEYAHFFILFRISLWQWYGLKAFTEDLNEYQSLEKLVYCWII